MRSVIIAKSASPLLTICAMAEGLPCLMVKLTLG